MWKGRFHDRDVAVKVLRVYECSDYDKIGRVGFLRRFIPIMRELTVTCRGFARRSYCGRHCATQTFCR